MVARAPTFAEVSPAGWTRAVVIGFVAYQVTAWTLVSIGQDTQHRIGYAVVLVVYTLPNVWLLRTAAVRVPRGATWVVLWDVALLTYLVLHEGNAWLRLENAVVLAALLAFRAPWSWLAAGVVLAVGVAITIDKPYDGAFGLAALAFALGLFLVLRIAVTARELEEARQARAARAVLKVRAHIEEQLGATLGRDLARLAADADQIAASDLEPAELRASLQGLSRRSRTAMATARSVAHRYRQPSLATEAQAGEGLLRATGMEAVVRVPDEQLSLEQEDAARTELRRRVSHALHHPVLGTAVAIDITAPEVSAS